MQTEKTRTAPSLRMDRTTATAVIGNLLEFFDFMSYAYFAVQIGNAFFPSGNKAVEALLSLLTFGLGFLTRPLGAIVFGWYGDRYGRRSALSWSFGLMALGTALLACAPTYAMIGITAPALVVIARMVQGFATGGEMGPASAFLCERGAPDRKAYFPSFQFATQSIAMALATGIGASLSLALTQDEIALWGWRVPFFLGILIAPVGLALRRSMQHGAPPAQRTAWRDVPLRAVIGIFLINGGESIRVYVQGYMVTYAILTLHMPGWKGMVATMLGAIVTASVSLIAGARIRDGMRFPVVIATQVAGLALVVPLFMLVQHAPSMLTLCILTIGLSLVTAPRSGAGLSLMIDSLPMAQRTLAFGTAYAMATTIFGSTTQVGITWIIIHTGSPLSPAFYLAGGLTLALSMYLLVLPIDGRRNRPIQRTAEPGAHSIPLETLQR